MNSMAPVTMLPATGGGGSALIIGAVLILALIYAKRQQSNASTTAGVSASSGQPAYRFPPIYERQ